jgi:acetyltransferase-like isoleucine patch superfamily enzyme
MEMRGDGYFEIGDNFRSAPGCVVITRNHNYYTSDAVPYDETYVRDDNVRLGVNVMIVPGVEISEGAIVQADSTVVNDVPRCAIVGGHPAEVISYRDIEHYEKLKNKDRFVPPSA